MSRNSSRNPSRAPHALDVPAATRSGSAGWRDPRLWIGVVLVTGSVVAGARLLSTADDMTSVWAASSDLAAGQTITADDLRATRLRFDDASDQQRYLGVDEELPATLTLTRPLAAGELVPSAALGEQSDDDAVDVSVAVAAEHVPTGLGRGSRVDVWVIGDDRGSRSEAELVLEDVLVVDAPVVSDSFAAATVRQLVLAVPRDDEESLGVLLAASGDDRVRVVGKD
ncbi:SAF domain-containing protein [Nocardioides KLBMP 9356]|uniref:SAF domain-containing protein n=1 Tax=Nocardioides potassii TaxID=2911371 RepID=A0ABS9H675_9ACTN|nr:SAF domain-containing protein [Nocardioides potassii]MCF6376750.1 SAF domain-containing protein [Nocardioides potassii]